MSAWPPAVLVLLTLIIAIKIAFVIAVIPAITGWRRLFTPLYMINLYLLLALSCFAGCATPKAVVTPTTPPQAASTVVLARNAQGNLIIEKVTEPGTDKVYKAMYSDDDSGLLDCMC